MTPEGRVKSKIDKLLSSRSDTWWFKPVQHGLGKRALDYIGCTNGHFWSVEAKAEGEDLRNMQRVTAWQLLQAGATVFMISSDEGVSAFRMWLERTSQEGGNEKWKPPKI